MGITTLTDNDHDNSDANLMAEYADILNMPNGPDKVIKLKCWHAELHNLPKDRREELEELAKVASDLKARIRS